MSIILIFLRSLETSMILGCRVRKVIKKQRTDFRTKHLTGVFDNAKLPQTDRQTDIYTYGISGQIKMHYMPLFVGVKYRD